jgi:hypothetical protein
LVQVYEKGVNTVKAMLRDDEPQFIAAALDGWSQHHHGYIGLHIGESADMQPYIAVIVPVHLYNRLFALQIYLEDWPR